jgi:uncharacterized protein YggE
LNERGGKEFPLFYESNLIELKFVYLPLNYNSMKNLFYSFLLFVCTVGFAQETNYTVLPQIQTKATFTTEVQPDIIQLSIILSENNTKGKVSLDEMERKFMSVLNANHIDISKQLNLKDLSSNFQSYFLKKTEVLKSKNYILELNDAKTAGKILRELADQDISNVKLAKTDYSKLEELKIELKGKAVEKAKRQAEEMAKATNQTVGKVLYISDAEINYLPQFVGQATGLNIRGVNSLPGYMGESEFDIQFDNIRVEATVTVYFKLD